MNGLVTANSETLVGSKKSTPKCRGHSRRRVQAALALTLLLIVDPLLAQDKVLLADYRQRPPPR